MITDTPLKNKGKANSLPIKSQAADLSLNLSYNSFDEFLDNFCNKLADSDLCPLDTKEDVGIAIITGRQLGINAMASVASIYPIQGRATLSSHLMSGLLTTAGCLITIDKDYEPMFKVFYCDTDDDGKVITKIREKDKKEIPSVIHREFKFADELPEMSDAVRISKAPTEFGTRITITRMLKQPDGSFKDSIVTKEYSTFDAKNVKDKSGRNLFEVKDSYRNYGKDMIYINAFRRAAKIIGSDIFSGLYSTDEMLDVSNTNYTINPENHAVEILDDDGKVIKTVK